MVIYNLYGHLLSERIYNWPCTLQDILCRATIVTAQGLSVSLCRPSSGQHFKPLLEISGSLFLPEARSIQSETALAWVPGIWEQHCLRLCPLGQPLMSTFINLFIYRDAVLGSEDTAENKIAFLPLGQVLDELSPEVARGAVP